MGKGVPSRHIANAVETVKREHALEIHPVGCAYGQYVMRRYKEMPDVFDAYTDTRIQVVEVKVFAKEENLPWGCYASIEMIYSSKGYRAVYGIKPDGTADCWMN